MLGQYGMILEGFRERSGARVACVTCDMFPPEAAAAAGLVPVRVPPSLAGMCGAAGISGAGSLEKLYDCAVVPAGCARGEAMRGLPVPVHEFRVPAGWGVDAAGMMAAELDALLAKTGRVSLRDIDPARLRGATEEYNAARRRVRGIASVRAGNPGLLSCGDLAVVFEAAAAFPPALVSGHLLSILHALNKAGSGGDAGRVHALVYGSCGGEGLLDAIEEEGCLVAGDDLCCGRGQFDMSYNADSAELLDEILDAFSYRPLCPSVRPLEERFELFYAMMKGYGIEAVIFIEDRCCPARLRDIPDLRTRLMRSGIDPIVATSGDVRERVKDYITRM